ncbi:hypothetical protein BJ166DRAFT_509077 [Pestalotiopsis sp. NC0098]|nr:hypothetical protein BJ166DRAFT_509077 [Pestalotiopsis sp. NC0098]
MAQELAPRLLLTQIIRTILIFFGVASLLNVHAYIGRPFAQDEKVTASLAASWTAVGWNALAVAAAAIHPYLQRFADGLPFPVSVTVRGRAVLSYGDGDDGVMAPLAGKLVFVFIDAVLATLLVVFQALARGLETECEWPPRGDGDVCLPGREVRVQAWVVNAWLTLAIFEYVIAGVQGFEALGIWYHSRYLKKRGQISLA